MHKMLTLKDLLAEVPLGERRLRDRLKELGYRADHRKMLFTRAQVETIKDALACWCGSPVTERWPVVTPAPAPSPSALSKKLREQLIDKKQKPSKRQA